MRAHTVARSHMPDATRDHPDLVGVNQKGQHSKDACSALYLQLRNAASLNRGSVYLLSGMLLVFNPCAIQTLWVLLIFR